MLNKHMTPNEFCIWLKGFLSAIEEGDIAAAQANIIKKTLHDVFDHSQHVSVQFTAPYEAAGILPPIQQTKVEGFQLPDHMDASKHRPNDDRVRC